MQNKCIRLQIYCDFSVRIQILQLQVLKTFATIIPSYSQINSWPDYKAFGIIFSKTLCKIFYKIFCKIFCGLKCNLNFATHGALRSVLQSRGRYSFSIWIKELKNLIKCYSIFIVITFANFIEDFIVTLHIKIHFE